MAKTRAKKIEIVSSLVEGLKAAKLIVLSEVKGLNMADTTKLRALLKKEQVGHKVVKISLLKLALRRLGIKTENLQLTTQVAVSYADDETAPARILKDFSRSNQQLKLLGGFLEKEYLDAGRISALASIPPRPVLLGQLVGALSGSLRGLATVLSGSHRGLVQVLSQVKK
ncbi:MAG: 50S ribosomal protein L10 [Candidatus Doudnabacteria bacterium]|nr:50S ribosomal protein L10 [Candidatus Doudnabacteria bacterium]